MRLTQCWTKTSIFSEVNLQLSLTEDFLENVIGVVDNQFQKPTIGSKHFCTYMPHAACERAIRASIFMRAPACWPQLLTHSCDTSSCEKFCYTRYTRCV